MLRHPLRKTALGVEQLQNRLVPAAADFVNGLYGDVLHRTAAPAEVDHWVGELHKGRSGSDIARAFVQSDERHGIEVEDLYQSILGRAADAGGKQAWIVTMRNGLGRDDVERQFLESPEFQSTHASNDAYIAGVYQKVLGRAPEARGAQEWNNALSHGVTRDAFVRAVQGSAENLGQHVDDLFRSDLGRSPSAAERSQTTNRIATGQSTLEHETASLLASFEYESGRSFLDDDVAGSSSFVTGLYTDVLHRTPNAVEVDSWLREVHSGRDGKSIAAAFVQSDEHHGIEVEDLYQALLGRAADAGGKAAWVGVLRSGATREDVERAIMGSPEFQAAHATNDAFIAATYQQILGRAPDAFGTASWKDALNKGLSRDRFVHEIQNSTENLGKHVDDFYQTYLGRTPSAAERDAWVREVASGRSSLDHASEDFLASGEYEQRHGFDDPAGHH